MRLWPTNLIKTEVDREAFDKKFKILQFTPHVDRENTENWWEEERKLEDNEVFKDNGKYTYISSYKEDGTRLYLFEKDRVTPEYEKQIKKALPDSKWISSDDVLDRKIFALFLNALGGEHQCGLEIPMFMLDNRGRSREHVGLKLLTWPAGFGSKYLVITTTACRIRPYQDVIKDSFENARPNKPLWMAGQEYPCRLSPVGENLDDAFVYYQNQNTRNAKCSYFKLNNHSISSIGCRSIFLWWCADRINRLYGSFIHASLIEMDCERLRTMNQSHYGKRVEERLHSDLLEVDLYDATNDVEAVQHLLNIINGKDLENKRKKKNDEILTRVNVVNKIDPDRKTLVIVPEEQFGGDGHEKSLDRKHIIVRHKPKKAGQTGELIPYDELRPKSRIALSELVNHEAVKQNDITLMYNDPEIPKKYKGWQFFEVNGNEEYGLEILEDGKIEWLETVINEPDRSSDDLSYLFIPPDGREYIVSPTRLKPIPDVEEVIRLLEPALKAKKATYYARDLSQAFKNANVPDEDNPFFEQNPETKYLYRQLDLILEQFKEEERLKEMLPSIRKSLLKYYEKDGIAPFKKSYKGKDVVQKCAYGLFDVCSWTYEDHRYISSGLASVGQSGDLGSHNGPVMYEVERADGEEVEEEILLNLADLMDSRLIRNVADSVKPVPFKLIRIAKDYGLLNAHEEEEA